MITEDYVSLEIAKLLKEKGFNEPCRLYYDKYHGYVPIFVEDSKLTKYGYKELVRNDQNSISDFIASAPSLYVTIKWLREVHKIDIWVECHNSNRRYKGYIHSEQRGDEALFYEDSYEEACESAIKYCLENLI